MNELISNGIHIYQFPTDDETVAEMNSTMNVSFKEHLMSLFTVTFFMIMWIHKLLLHIMLEQCRWC